MSMRMRVVITLAGALAMMVLGASAAGAKTFSNPGAITIPEVDNATPYPSQITVSGQKAPISDLNVKLNGFSHTYPDDVGVVLVAPGGQALDLMDCVGGPTDAANVNLTIDDSAAAQMTDADPLTSGTFKPTNHCAVLDSFIAPGPLTSYGNPGPGLGGTATLASGYNGTTANGVWNLFVRDFGGPSTPASWREAGPSISCPTRPRRRSARRRRRRAAVPPPPRRRSARRRRRRSERRACEARIGDLCKE